MLVLEQGPRLTAADFRHDEFDYWFNLGPDQQARHEPADLPQDGAARPHSASRDFPAAWYAPMVGGSSNHFTGNFWRFHEVDFDERSRLGAIAGTTFADWPITYAELEPYYTKVEWEVGVSGLAGASPFDPPRSKPYPMPPLPVKSSGVLLERGARKLGLHPFPAPMAIASRAVPRPPGLRALRLLHRLRLRDAREVVDAVHDDSRGRGDRPLRGAAAQLRRAHRDQRGRAAPPASPISTRDKREHFQKARAVVVCANGAEIGAPAADVGQREVSRRPREFERHGRRAT